MAPSEAGYRFLHEVDDHSHAVRYPIFDVGHSIQFSETAGIGIVDIDHFYRLRLKGVEHIHVKAVAAGADDDALSGIVTKKCTARVTATATSGSTRSVLAL